MAPIVAVDTHSPQSKDNDELNIYENRITIEGQTDSINRYQYLDWHITDKTYTKNILKTRSEFSMSQMVSTLM